MKESSEDTIEELKKNSEKRNRKLKFAGKVAGYLYLALFFGVAILIAKELGASLDLYCIAGILVIILVFSFLSMWIGKKTKGIEKYSTSTKIIRLIIIVFMLISIVIFFRLSSGM